MKKITVVLFALMCINMLPACNNENPSNKVAEESNENKFDNTGLEEDAEFVMEAAGGGMMEVELGNHAAANGSSDIVKDFGRNMAADHSKANEELTELARNKNITLPSVPPEKMQSEINDLKQKTGADFDKAYIDLMVDDHKKDIEHFQKEADNGRDADIKAWAAGKISVLQHHLQMAEDAQARLKKM